MAKGKRPVIAASGLRAAAALRVGDARLLINFGDRDREAGAIYLGGFAIECMVKALLLDVHPNLVFAVDPDSLSPSDRAVHRELYGHDLNRLLNFLPNLKVRLRSDVAQRGLGERLEGFISAWTITLRYTPRRFAPGSVRRAIDTVEESIRWLRQL